MKRVIIIYGLISSLLVAGMMWATMPLLANGTIDFSNGMFYGYASMVIALSLVFFGIKSYRDNYLNGAITFGKGFKVGILITLIASVAYCLSWEVCYATVFSDFGEKYQSYYIDQVRASGASDTEVKAQTEQMAQNFEMYKNPVIRFGMTLMEILPVGLVITLISAGLLRKKEVLPA
jgi:hypothetical protein